MKNAAENFTLDENGITVDAKDKVVNIHVSGSIPEVNTPNSIDYMIYGNGEIVVTNTVTPSASAGNIARIGMKMTVAKDYEKLTYYGNGPQANYVDRNTGAKLGIYNSTVTEQFEKKYVKPQENGNHTGVRWTALTAEDGTGILVSSDSEMESGALHILPSSISGTCTGKYNPDSRSDAARTWKCKLWSGSAEQIHYFRRKDLYTDIQHPSSDKTDIR